MRICRTRKSTMISGQHACQLAHAVIKVYLICERRQDASKPTCSQSMPKGTMPLATLMSTVQLFHLAELRLKQVYRLYRAIVSAIFTLKMCCPKTIVNVQETGRD